MYFMELIHTISEDPGVCAGICPLKFLAIISWWMNPIDDSCANTFVLKPSEQYHGDSIILLA